MAGIGVKLNKIFEKNTLTTDMLGFVYSSVVTIAPMMVVILNLMLMEHILGFSKVGYAQRELFSCTVLPVYLQRLPENIELLFCRNGICIYCSSDS